jgi:hypothetical protein
MFILLLLKYLNTAMRFGGGDLFNNIEFPHDLTSRAGFIKARFNEKCLYEDAL